jgi:hypothetical protein
MKSFQRGYCSSKNDTRWEIRLIGIHNSVAQEMPAEWATHHFASPSGATAFWKFKKKNAHFSITLHACEIKTKFPNKVQIDSAG